MRTARDALRELAAEQRSRLREEGRDARRTREGRQREDRTQPPAILRGEGDNPLVLTDCCGRKRAADMVVDLGALPEAVRPRGARYVCDGCRFRMRASGVVTREELRAAIAADGRTGTVRDA